MPEKVPLIKDFYGPDWLTTCASCNRGFPHPQRSGYAICPECSESGAEWVDLDCPKCDAPFVAQDKFGLWCNTGRCAWRQSIKELAEAEKTEEPITLTEKE